MIRVAAPPSKPVLVFDGDCNFCRRWIARWREDTGERVEFRPFQDPQVAAQFPEIPREAYTEAVHLIEPDGTVSRGAEAVFRARGRRLWPGLAPLSEWAYRLVARHRSFFSLLTKLLWGDSVERPQYFLTRWLFLRMLGVIYLIAFESLGVQINGLLGQNGIIPAGQYMEAARNWASGGHAGNERYWLLPTLCWISASDGFLHFLCWGGAALAVLLIAGVAPTLMLAGLWLFYLSLTVVGGVFLSFQWDVLLLETGFLAIFFAPLQLRPRLATEPPPSRLILFLLRWLLFRLMFASGVVKLASGDVSWHNLTALTVHYETQPLPTWIGWYAHQLPTWWQTFSCAVMFGIELGLPFLIFLPRRPRFVAAGGFALLMVLIALTGNYCFFNLLALALCVLLLDDAVLRWRGFGKAMVRRDGRYRHWLRWRTWLLIPVAVGILQVSVPQILRTCRLRVRWPRPLLLGHYTMFQAQAPFRIVNSYGLFAVMTSHRPEIIIEGSTDGVSWQAYEFKYKPGDVNRRPRFVEPHQPRLDWQMWFAALGRYQDNPWFIDFCARVLQGQPEVLALLGHNPFPDAPPRYLRAVVYDYHFTNFAERRATGAWWRRELKGLYCPVLSRQDQ